MWWGWWRVVEEVEERSGGDGGGRSGRGGGRDGRINGVRVWGRADCRQEALGQTALCNVTLGMVR